MTASAIASGLRTSPRHWLVAAALLPAITLQSAIQGWRFPWLTVLAPLMAIAGDAAGRWLRGQPAMRAVADGYPVQAGAVFALCLPALTGAPSLTLPLAALFLACAARNARHPAFPPAMAALAALALLPLAANPAPPSPHWRIDFVAPERALAMSYVAAGLALAAARIVRLPASLAVLTGAMLALLAAPASGQPSDIAPSTLTLLAFVLVADPSLACAGRRASVLAGLLLGALTVALPGASGPLAALPFAALLVAVCAPWLDGIAAPSRSAAEPSA